MIKFFVEKKDSFFLKNFKLATRSVLKKDQSVVAKLWFKAVRKVIKEFCKSLLESFPDSIMAKVSLLQIIVILRGQQ